MSFLYDARNLGSHDNLHGFRDGHPEFGFDRFEYELHAKKKGTRTGQVQINENIFIAIKNKHRKVISRETCRGGKVCNLVQEEEAIQGDNEGARTLALSCDKSPVRTMLSMRAQISGVKPSTSVGMVDAPAAKPNLAAALCSLLSICAVSVPPFCRRQIARAVWGRSIRLPGVFGAGGPTAPHGWPTRGT
jgi:hypothetical protein